MNEWALNEDQIRAKVIELLEGMNQRRMDAWLISGVTAKVLDPELVEMVMTQEIEQSSHDVKRFWLGQCNCHGLWN